MQLSKNEQMLWTVAESLPFQLREQVVFLGRGNNDFMASHDLEDIITLLDGRQEIVSEIETSEKSLKSYLIAIFASWLKNKAFLGALPGHLPPDIASQQRLSIILQRIEAIVNLE